MLLVVRIVDVLLVLAVVMIIGKTFEDADRVSRARERIRQESERSIAQIEQFLERHHHHPTS